MRLMTCIYGGDCQIGSSIGSGGLVLVMAEREVMKRSFAMAVCVVGGERILPDRQTF